MLATEKYRAQGYNCAEAIIQAFNEEYGMELPTRAATAFGGGLSSGGVCGAVTGALMALGALYGRDDAAAPNVARVPAKAFVRKMKERYGSLDCCDLKGGGVSCNALVETAYQTMKECAKEADAEEA